MASARKTSVNSFSGLPRSEPQASRECDVSQSFVKTHRGAVNPPKTSGGHYIYFDEHIAQLRAIYERNTRRARRAG